MLDDDFEDTFVVSFSAYTHPFFSKYEIYSKLARTIVLLTTPLKIISRITVGMKLMPHQGYQVSISWSAIIIYRHLTSVIFQFSAVKCNRIVQYVAQHCGVARCRVHVSCITINLILLRDSLAWFCCSYHRTLKWIPYRSRRWRTTKSSLITWTFFVKAPQPQSVDKGQIWTRNEDNRDRYPRTTGH